MKIIFEIVASFMGLAVVVVIKAVKSCAVWMDDSFRWGGRDGNGY